MYMCYVEWILLTLRFGSRYLGDYDDKDYDDKKRTVRSLIEIKRHLEATITRDADDLMEVNALGSPSHR